MIEWLILGRLTVWTAQIAGPLDPIRKRAQGLFDCDFCLGFWVFTALSIVLKPRVLSKPLSKKAFLIEHLINGLFGSFIMHLVRIGWETKFNA